MVKLTVNGRAEEVDMPADTPLLWALRDNLGLTGTKFGCGMAQCGACTVHVDGEATRSCVYPVAAVAGRSVTTLAGLGTPEKPHPLQTAFVTEQVPQCGYCLSGWVMTAAAFLKRKPKATQAEIEEALAGLKCRCATQVAMMRAIRLAQKSMA